METLKKLEENFINACISHRESSDNGDYKKANQQYSILVKIYKQLIQIENGTRLFQKLMQYPHPAVQQISAVYSLPFFEQEAKKKLLDLKTRDDMIGIGAKTALDEWDNGTLKL